MLFDAGGTLVDSNDLHVLAWEAAFDKVDASFDRHTIHDQIGKGTDMLVPALLSDADEALQQRLGDVHATVQERRSRDRAGLSRRACGACGVDARAKRSCSLHPLSPRNSSISSFLWPLPDRWTRRPLCRGAANGSRRGLDRSRKVISIIGSASRVPMLPCASPSVWCRYLATAADVVRRISSVLLSALAVQFIFDGLEGAPALN